MKKILIFGNSGSGKSTMAASLSDRYGIPHLDLDNISWSKPGVRMPIEESIERLNMYIASNKQWVIEGCYGSLIEAAAEHCTEMYFLNPGIEICIDHNRQRPWESHKYKSKEEQDNNLEMLQNWVREYEVRDDEYSLTYHRMIFDDFIGNKQEYTTEHK